MPAHASLLGARARAKKTTTLPVFVRDSLPPIALDSLPDDSLLLDSTALDSANMLLMQLDNGVRLERGQIRISKDSLSATVAYTMEDSMHVDFPRKEIHLFGSANVKYEGISLTADQLVLNWESNIVEASPLATNPRPEGKPAFSDGSQEFTSERIRYNFQTQKGIVYSAVTTQEDIYVRSNKSKFFSKAYVIDDTTKADIIYAQGALFTTCSAEHPHFGIRTAKAKVIPNKLAIVGPSHLEIMGIPTPLALPFGFFPLKSGRTTGLLFGDYEFSPQWGFGFRDLGWFFPVGEHLNIEARGDIYFKGTYALGLSGNYRKRYKYSGSFITRFNKQRQENTETGVVTFEPSLSINWSHRQDPSAHPTATLGGSVNFQTNRAQSRVFNSYDAVSRNVINSNVNFSKRWDDKPFTLTAGLSHSQNNQTQDITVNFPQVAFQTSTIYPFRRPVEKRIGKERWYEQINFRYKNELRATFTGKDTSFFRPDPLNDRRAGFRHDINSGISLNVLKYFNIAPNIAYSETYYDKNLMRSFDYTQGVQTREVIDENGNLTLDTIVFGTIQEITETGLKSFRTFSAGVSVSTQFFGTARFKAGPLRGLRHVVKPSVSFGYQPNYLANDNYFDVLPNVNDPFDPQRFTNFNRFSQGIYGGPPASEQQMAINYSINNLFEAKIWSRKDSTARNVKLFQNIAISGNYNFAADSLKWSPIQMSGATRFFKGITTLNLNATFDPYERIFDGGSDMGRRVNITTLSASQVPFKLTNFRGTISTNITVAKIRELFQGKEEEVVTDLQEERRRQRERDNALFEETDLLSLFENFSIRHNYNFRLNRLVDQSGENGRDTLRFESLANSIELRGRIQLTENWQAEIGSIGYDFVSKRITYPFLGLTRDLHCWEMRFNWAPTRGTYTFSIAVKPGTLDFLNVPYNRNRIDAEALGGNMF